MPIDSIVCSSLDDIMLASLPIAASITQLSLIIYHLVAHTFRTEPRPGVRSTERQQLSRAFVSNLLPGQSRGRQDVVGIRLA